MRIAGNQRSAKWVLPFVGGAVVLLIAILWRTGILRSKGEGPPERPAPEIAVPDAVKAGESSFIAHCARCHGRSAAGTDQGPSLILRIYAPNHHSDVSFYQAVNHGVRAHHGRFGDMPTIPDVREDEVTQIIAYVRWLQQRSGVR